MTAGAVQGGSSAGPRITVSQFLRDLALTTVTSLATIAALLLFARLLATQLGPVGFGAVMLARRVIATLDPVSTLAMGVAVTRFAALADPAARHRVLTGGTVLAMGAGLTCAVIAILAAAPLGRLLFDSTAYAPLVRGTALVVAAYSAFIVLYSWYRGTERMALANAWQLWAIAAGPVCVVWLVARPGSEWKILAWLAALLATAALPLAWEIARPPDGRIILDWKVTRALAAYAAPRVPGGLAFGALLAVAPLMAPHVNSLAAVGYIATGQALLRVVEGATEAFGRVALGKVSQLFAAGEQTMLRERIGDLSAVVVHIGVFAMCQLWLWAPELVRVWLGPEYEPGVPVVRLVVLAVLPYLLFVTLRSVLDAVEERAVNATNLYAAIAVTVAGSIVLGRWYGAEGLAAAMTVGLAVLGALTFAAVHRRYPFATRLLMLPQVLLVNGVLLALAAAARVAAVRFGGNEIGAALVTEMTLTAAYGLVLWHLGARWMREIGRRIQVRPA